MVENMRQTFSAGASMLYTRILSLPMLAFYYSVAAAYMVQPLQAGTPFRITQTTFSDSTLMPVLARAAYLQTYEANLDSELFEKRYPGLRLHISFRGDIRFFAISEEDRVLVAGVRSHRPDAMPSEKYGNLREFVVFAPDLKSRKHDSSFFLLEPGGDTDLPVKKACQGETHWLATEHSNPSAVSADPAQWKAEFAEATACAGPGMMYHWLEHLRNDGFTDSSDHQSATHTEQSILADSYNSRVSFFLDLCKMRRPIRGSKLGVKNETVEVSSSDSGIHTGLRHRMRP